MNRRREVVLRSQAFFLPPGLHKYWNTPIFPCFSRGVEIDTYSDKDQYCNLEHPRSHQCTELLRWKVAGHHKSDISCSVLYHMSRYRQSKTPTAPSYHQLKTTQGHFMRLYKVGIKIKIKINDMEFVWNLTNSHHMQIIVSS